MRRATLVSAILVAFTGGLVAQAAAPFSSEVRGLSGSRPRHSLAADLLRPPTVTLFASASSGSAARTKESDRSPILRSFNPSLKRPNPYLSPQQVNIRQPIKW